MQIEIKLEPECKETTVVITAAQMTDEVQSIVRKLSEEAPKVLTGFKEDKAKIIEPDEVLRIYASGGKVYVVTSEGEYSVRNRLYEIEERLGGGDFVRISNSEMINLKKVKNFDLSFSGTICVVLCDKTVTYVSRRYVKKIKQILGI